MLSFIKSKRKSCKSDLVVQLEDVHSKLVEHEGVLDSRILQVQERAYGFTAIKLRLMDIPQTSRVADSTRDEALVRCEVELEKLYEQYFTLLSSLHDTRVQRDVIELKLNDIDLINILKKRSTLTHTTTDSLQVPSLDSEVERDIARAVFSAQAFIDLTTSDDSSSHFKGKK